MNLLMQRLIYKKQTLPFQWGVFFCTLTRHSTLFDITILISYELITYNERKSITFYKLTRRNIFMVKNKQNKKGEKKFNTGNAILSTSFLAYSVLAVSPMPTHAVSSNQTIVKDNLVQTSPTQNVDSVTSPDAPVSFTLSATSKILKDFQLDKQKQGKDTFGILITDGTNDYLSTLSNGDLSYEIKNGNIIFTGEHEVLDRYKEYKAYLLNGSLFNKYMSELKSNGHSNAFQRALEKDNYATISFQTGSNIGEPTQWKTSMDENIPSVLTGSKVHIEATDDYGNLAKSGEVTVKKVETTDGSILSDSFSIPESISLVNGKGVIDIENHKAQKISITLETSGEFKENVHEFNYDIEFQPGSAHFATMNPVGENEITAGNTTKIEGHVTDKYDNVVKPTVLEFVSEEGTVQTTAITDENGRYEVSLTAPTKLDQSEGLTDKFEVSLSSEMGEVKSTLEMVAQPEKPIQTELVKDSFVAGEVSNVEAIVKDQYGNLVLPTDVSVNTSTGEVEAKVKTDDKGMVKVNYKAPKKLNQSNGLSEKVKVDLQFDGVEDTKTVEVMVHPNSPKYIQIDPIAEVKIGEEVQINGTVTDEFGNLVADNTPISLLDGTTLIEELVTKNGKFSKQYSPSKTFNLMAITGDIQSEAIEVDVLPDSDSAYSGETKPENVETPKELERSGDVQIGVNEAFKLPQVSYDANNYVPFYYWSEFPVVNPSDFNKSVYTRSGDTMWLNEAPYGYGYTPNGLLFFRTTFTLTEATDVRISIPNVDDVALAYVDSKPVAYNQDITYHTGFASQGINLPSSTGTVHLEAGTHSIILEVANAYTPGSGNNAGVRLHAVDVKTGKTVATTANPSAWTSTGYVTEPPISWYFEEGEYTISQTLLNFRTLSVGTSSKWVIDVKDNTTVETVVEEDEKVEGMPGFTIPENSLITANSHYSTATPDKVFDQNPFTAWNSGGYTGWIQILFPDNEERTISAIQLSANTLPSTYETYTIYGLEDGVWKQISSPTRLFVERSPDNNFVSLLPQISVTEGTYEGVKIEVNGGASWVSINEVTFIR
jgi:hypothetical protein